MTEPELGPQDSIRQALRDLPRVGASAGFNRRLLARTARPRTQQARAWPRLAAAMLVLAVFAAGLAFQRQRSERLDYQRQRAALEQRHEELRRELAEFRQRAVRSPRLYLGASSDVDLVLDLEPWMNPPLSVQPAAYTRTRP